MNQKFVILVGCIMKFGLVSSCLATSQYRICAVTIATFPALVNMQPMAPESTSSFASTATISVHTTIVSTASTSSSSTTRRTSTSTGSKTTKTTTQTTRTSPSAHSSTTELIRTTLAPSNSDSSATVAWWYFVIATFGVLALVIVIVFCYVCCRRIETPTEVEEDGKRTRKKRRFFQRRRRHYIHGPKLRHLAKGAPPFDDSTGSMGSTSGDFSGDLVLKGDLVCAKASQMKSTDSEGWMCVLPPRDKKTTEVLKSVEFSQAGKMVEKKEESVKKRMSFPSQPIVGKISEPVITKLVDNPNHSYENPLQSVKAKLLR